MSSTPEDFQERVKINAKSAEGNAEYYDNFWKKFPVQPTGTERSRGEFAARMVALYKPDGAKRILDIGCGRGWMSSYLSSFGQVVGIDFAPEAIEGARKHYGEHGLFYVVDAYTDLATFSDSGQFDVIVCSEVIEHVEDQSTLLKQIHSLLNSGGLCILTTPNAHLWDKLRHIESFQQFIQPIENWLLPKQLRRLVVVNGFQVLQHEGFAVHGMRQGNPLEVFLQHRKIGQMLREMGLGFLHGKWLLNVGMYQYLAARRK